ncbi:MAG: acyltransferase [Candidatus Altiarchaeota archaeon]|nr:acyltransferase [Candidatus Altiarchaeota archaeon]
MEVAMRKVRRVLHTGGRNSLKSWWRVKNPVRVVFNFMVIYFCRRLPSLRVKSALYRLTGMKVGSNVSVGLDAVFDIFFPELIEIRDNAIVGFGTTVLAHEFLREEVRVGRVIIGRDVVIGANTTILPGVSVGDGSTVSAMSLVNRDIEKGVLAGGVPARKISGEG